MNLNSLNDLIARTATSSAQAARVSALALELGKACGFSLPAAKELALDTAECYEGTDQEADYTLLTTAIHSL